MTTSIMDFLRAVTAPPKRKLSDFRRNIEIGDTALHQGTAYTVSNLRTYTYGEPDVKLHREGVADVWVPISEVFLP